MTPLLHSLNTLKAIHYSVMSFEEFIEIMAEEPNTSEIFFHRVLWNDGLTITGATKQEVLSISHQVLKNIPWKIGDPIPIRPITYYKNDHYLTEERSIIGNWATLYEVYKDANFSAENLFNFYTMPISIWQTLPYLKVREQYRLGAYLYLKVRPQDRQEVQRYLGSSSLNEPFIRSNRIPTIDEIPVIAMGSIYRSVPIVKFRLAMLGYRGPDCHCEWHYKWVWKGKEFQIDNDLRDDGVIGASDLEVLGLKVVDVRRRVDPGGNGDDISNGAGNGNDSSNGSGTIISYKINTGSLFGSDTMKIILPIAGGLALAYWLSS